MPYSKEAAKWKAFQFSDPFATNAFVVCNKISKTFCRPDCDARPKTDLKSEIKFLEFSDDALQLGFVPCKYCDPMNAPGIDVKLLVQCVETINKQIGFLTPLLDEDEDHNNDKIKANILELKKTNEQQILNVIEHGSGRRQSMPNFDEKSKEVSHVNLSKNDSDHYRLVDLACRHLASAAAINLFFPKKYDDEVSSPGTSAGGKKKRRRGGVLGFKELAAKSKLSAWHFHRVFKSVTGLTPKTYGDRCNEFLESFKDSKYINYSKFNQSITPVSHSESPVEFEQMQSQPNKRMKLSNSPISPSNTNVNNTTMNMNPINDGNVLKFENNLDGLIPDNFMFDYRASSVPDLTKYNFQPQLDQFQPQYQAPQPQYQEPQFQPQSHQPSIPETTGSGESIDALLEQSSLTNTSQQSLSSMAGPITPQPSLFSHYKPEDVDLQVPALNQDVPVHHQSHSKPSFELSSPNMNLEGQMDLYPFNLNPIDEVDNQDFNEFLTSF